MNVHEEENNPGLVPKKDDQCTVFANVLCVLEDSLGYSKPPNTKKTLNDHSRKSKNDTRIQYNLLPDLK